MTTAAHPHPQPQPQPIDAAVCEALQRLLHGTAAALQGPWRTEVAVREAAGTVAGVLTAAELELLRRPRSIRDPWVAAAMLATELDRLTARVTGWIDQRRAAGDIDTGVGR